MASSGHQRSAGGAAMQEEGGMFLELYILVFHLYSPAFSISWGSERPGGGDSPRPPSELRTLEDADKFASERAGWQGC